ncbi:MAG: WGR domain-containing protein [Myxococcota bacterium]
MKKRRFELEGGGVSKFWEIERRGAAYSTFYGRIGSTGRRNTRECASAKEAERKVAALVKAKLAKGYVEAKAKKRVGKAASAGKKGKTSSNAGSRFVSVAFEGGWLNGYQAGSALVFVGADELPADAEHGLDEHLDEQGFVQRLDFATAAHAQSAAKLFSPPRKARRGVDATMPKVRTAAPGRVDRLALFEKAPKGPVKVTMDAPHEWVHPRGPGQSVLSGQTLVPVLAVSGSFDKRFAKGTRIFVSACPQLGEYVDQVVEVVVQGKTRNSKTDRYFINRGGYFVTLHLSLRWNLVEGTGQWVVHRHVGHESSLGDWTTEGFDSQRAAESHFKTEGARLKRRMDEVDTMKPAYARLVRRGAELQASPRGKAKDVFFRPLTRPFSEARPINNSWLNAEALLGPHTQGLKMGGFPTMVQDAWNKTPKGPSKRKPLHLLSSRESGDTSSALNHADYGSISIFVAPGDEFGQAILNSH